MTDFKGQDNLTEQETQIVEEIEEVEEVEEVFDLEIEDAIVSEDAPGHDNRKRTFFYAGLALILFIVLSAITLWILPRYQTTNDIEQLTKISFGLQFLEKNFIAESVSDVQPVEKIEENVRELTKLIEVLPKKNSAYNEVGIAWLKLKNSLSLQGRSVDLLKELPQLDYRTTEELKSLNRLLVNLSMDLSAKKSVSLETIRAIDLLAAYSQQLDANIVRLLNLGSQSQLSVISTLTENLNLIQSGINELIVGKPESGIQGLKGSLEEETINEIQLVFNQLGNNISSFIRNTQNITTLKAIQKDLSQQKNTIQNLLQEEILATYEHQLVTTKKISGSTIILGMLLVASISLFVLMILMLRNQLAIYKFEAYTEKETNERHEKAILQMIKELGDLGKGDLGVELTVTDDTTGVLADSFNVVIENFRLMIGSVKDLSADVCTKLDLNSDKMNQSIESVRNYGQNIAEVQQESEIFGEKIYTANGYIDELIKQSKLIVEIYGYFEQALEHDLKLLEDALDGVIGQDNLAVRFEPLRTTLTKQKGFFREGAERLSTFEQLIVSLNGVFSGIIDKNSTVYKNFTIMNNKTRGVLSKIEAMDRDFKDFMKLAKRLEYTITRFKVPINRDSSLSFDLTNLKQEELL